MLLAVASVDVDNYFFFEGRNDGVRLGYRLEGPRNVLAIGLCGVPLFGGNPWHPRQEYPKRPRP